MNCRPKSSIERTGVAPFAAQRLERFPLPLGGERENEFPRFEQSRAVIVEGP